MIYRILATSEPLQEQSFRLFGYSLRFTLRYNAVGKNWNYDLFDCNAGLYIARSFGLAVNAPSLIGKNLPFVVVLDDASRLGINSTGLSDMGNRLQVLFMDKDTYHEAIRAAN